MKRITTILIPMLFVLSGCTFVTSYRDFDICQNSHEGTVQDDSIWIYINIVGTISSKNIIPLVYDTDIRKDPYRCHLAIWGEFEEIKSASATFILNGRKLAPLPLSIAKMNDGKEDLKDGRSRFPAGGFDLPFTWAEIVNLEMDIKIIAIDSNGKSVEYSEKKTFKKHLRKRNSNRSWETILHV